jgi:hypothetical protein
VPNEGQYISIIKTKESTATCSVATWASAQHTHSHHFRAQQEITTVAGAWGTCGQSLERKNSRDTSIECHTTTASAPRTKRVGSLCNHGYGWGSRRRQFAPLAPGEPGAAGAPPFPDPPGDPCAPGEPGAPGAPPGPAWPAPPRGPSGPFVPAGPFPAVGPAGPVTPCCMRRD